MEVRNVVLRKVARRIQGLLVLLLLSWSVQGGVQSGYVYTRAPVLNPNTGAEIWGEYDPQTGAYIRDIADAAGQYDPQQVMILSGAQFKAYDEQYQELRRTFADPDTGNLGKFLYSRDEFQSTVFTTVGGEPITDKPLLRSSTTHVAVRPREQLYSNDPTQLIVAEFPVNPEALIGAGTVTVLVNAEGEPLYQSMNRIGIKAAFLSEAGGGVINPDTSQNRKHDDQIHGPVPGVEVEGYNFSRTVTDDDGRYVLYWADIPCPLFHYTIDGHVTARLESRRFNPRMQSTPYPYYLLRPYSIICTPNVFIIPFIGPWPIDMGTATVYPPQLDFTVDTMVLSGTAHLADRSGGLIPVEEQTRYESQNVELQTTTSDFYDFDGDGTNDTVVKGYWLEETDPATGAVTKKFEIATGDTDGVELLQGVYLSSGTREPGTDAPDFTRLLDWTTNFEHEGLVTAISEEDLRNTDLYVFRLSDGKLISERLGLAASDGLWKDELGASAQESRFYYHTYLRGYSGDRFRYSLGNYATAQNYADWQAKSGINPELHQRQADHLKPGDRVEIVAINRATGYMGSVQTTMQAAGENGLGRNLSWDIEEIKLQPPNLKIWVERNYEIKEGLRAGYDADHIVGYEGAALSDDRTIVIYTDWRKPDGSALPVMDNGNEADYGYTGRIAYLSADKTVAGDSSYGVAHFAIKPGKHTQVLQLPGGVDANKHLYIQVSGEPESGRPVFTNISQAKTANFQSTGVHDGKLQPRPDRFVPFLVPVFDEENTETQRQIYRQLKRDNPEVSYQKPKPVYRWQYRPEFQYSIYGFIPQELSRQAEDNPTSHDLFDGQPQLISPSDDLIALVYDLDIINYLPLDYFNAGEEKELVFAVGEHEVRAKVNERDRIEFKDLEHLASLDPEDFLTIQLYTNNDAGNVLWEYAFGGMLTTAPQTAQISADFPDQDLVAYLPVNLNDVRAGKGKSVRLAWSVEGNAQVESTITESDSGVFTNTLSVVPTVTQSDIYVTVRVVFSDNPYIQVGAQRRMGPYRLIPGAAKKIELQPVATNLLTTGVDETDLVAHVFDQHGNSVSDGTVLSWRLEGSGNLKEVVSETVGGKATAVYQVGKELDPSTIHVSVDQASSATSITKRPFTVELTSDRQEITANSHQQATLTATVNEAPSQPAPVSWYTSRGELIAQETLSGTSVQATLKADEIPGEGYVVVNIAGSRSQVAINHRAAGVGSVQFDYAAIVSDAAGSASTVETLQGSATHAHVTTTYATVYGAPGTTIDLRAGGFYTPNARPSLYLGMTELDSEWDQTLAIWRSYVHDISQNLKAYVDGNISLDTAESYTLPGASLQFTDGTLSVAASPSLAINDHLFVNLRVRPSDSTSDATLIRQGTPDGTAFAIYLKREGTEWRVEAELTTDQGSYRVVSSETLVANQWAIVGLRFEDNMLKLGVNHSRNSEAAPGLIIHQGFAANISIGEGYQGHLDEIRMGQESAAQALVTFESGSLRQTITVGSDGTARIPVSATGINVPIGQRIGFTATYQTLTGQIESRELKVAKRVFGPVLTALGVKPAYADGVITHAVQEHEDGLAVVPGEQFAQAVEMMKNAGSQVFDFVKSAAEFLYDMSGLSDIYTIGRALYLWINDRFDEVDKFDLVFAGIGLTLSIVAIVTSPTGAGAGAALSLKAALRGLKATLKELVSDPVALLHAGGVVVNWTVALLKDFFTGRSDLARQRLQELGDLFVHMLSASGRATLALFAGVVRSVRSFELFLKVRSFRKLDCPLQVTDNRLRPDVLIQQRIFGPIAAVLNSEKAYAASSCSLLIDDIVSVMEKVPEAEKKKVFEGIATVLEKLKENDEFIAVSSESVDRLRKIVSGGYYEGFLRLMSSNPVLRGELNRAAKVYTNGGEGVDLGISAFDELVRSMDILASLGPQELIGAEKFLHNLGYYNGIKGVYGELKSIKSIKEQYPNARLISVNDRVNIAKIDGSVLDNVEGVDSVWSFVDDKGKVRALYVESKNYMAAGDGSLSKLKEQFRKHIETKIVRDHIEVGPDVFRWVGDSAPMIQYEVRGSFFTEEVVEKMYKEFDGMIKSGGVPFNSLKDVLEDTGMSLRDILKITRDPQTIPPLST